MDVATLLKMLCATLGVAGAIMLAAMGIFWKVPQRERWLPAIGPIALAAGFAAGYVTILEFPRALTDPSWKFAVLTISAASLPLAVALALPQRVAWLFVRWSALAALIAVVTWLTVRRLNEHQAACAWACAGALVLYFFCLGPSSRERRAWAIGPIILFPTAFAATSVCLLWIDPAILGRMLMMTTALAALSLAIGVVARLRPIARGAGPMLAVMLAVLLTLTTYYNGQQSIRWWNLAWIAAAPLAAAIVWARGMRARPWIAALFAMLAAVAILLPAVLFIVNRAPHPFP